MFKSYKSRRDVATCDVLISPKTLFTWNLGDLHVHRCLTLVENFRGELLYFPLRALQFNYCDLNEQMHKAVLEL
jgi:hypothetical protein